MKTLKALMAAAAIVVGFAGFQGAKAADLGEPGMKDEAGPASIWGPGWMVRLRAVGVIPQEGSSNWRANGTPTSELDLYPNLSISNSIIPEMDISYFFTKNIAIEAICCVTPHDIDGKGDIAGLGKIGDTWILPATVTLQYHFDMGEIKPYVGAGVSYFWFFGEDAGPNYRNLDLDNSFGVALQAGVDVHLKGNWFLNVDVKKIWLDTKASVNIADHVPDLGGAHVTTDVDIDPWVVGVGIGYKFGGAEPLPPLK